MRRHPGETLKMVLSQWQEASPEHGLIRALKDRPPTWYSGANKDKFGMKRFSRQVIALEYLDK